MRQWTEHVVRFMSSVPVCIFLRHVKSTSLARQTKERRIANGRRTPIANRPTPPPLAGMKVIVAILALLGGTCDALRLPAGVTRRVAIGGALVPALFLPSAAVAKYRPSLAEFKGYGSSPLLDEAGSAPATNLSHAQLVANSVKMQEDMLGRSLTEEEVAAIDVRRGHTREACMPAW